MAVTIKGMSGAVGKAAMVGVYSKHLETPYKQVVATTHVQKNVSKNVIHEGQTQEVVHPGLAGECRMAVTGARTINTGNYENVKISVTLDMPCQKTDLEATYEYITDWIGNKLTEAAKAVKE